MTQSSLSEAEMASWLRFRFTVEETSLRVSRELARATGISVGQFGILNTLTKATGGELRQQKLTDLMRWDRTRASHQLTRMAKAGLVQRVKRPPKGTAILITELGRSELGRIRPVLAKAVRKHYFARLTPAQLKAVDDLAAALRDCADVFTT
jgi:DNA-binding MarR family transcriptional regulator